MEVAEENLKAARTTLREAENEVREIEADIEEASTIGDRDWSESLQKQLEMSLRMVQRIRQAVKVEEELVRHAQPN